MSVAALWPALLSLLGVGLGVAGTLGSQYVTHKTASDRLRAERVAALYVERKQAILDFLEAVQDLERHLEDRPQRGPHNDDSQGKTLMHRVWLRQKLLDLVCADGLRQPADAFAHGLHEAVWDGVSPDELYARLDVQRTSFLTAARAELRETLPASG